MRLISLLTGHWRAARFIYSTLIAPWPLFTWFLIVSAFVGGILPFIQIRVTAGLVDAVTSHSRFPMSGYHFLFRIMTPFIPWLLLLLMVMILNWIIYMDTFQRYLAAHLNERIQERFDSWFYDKVGKMRLEYMEQSSYLDQVGRAQATMNGQQVTTQLAQLQRLFTTSFSLVGILGIFSTVHVALPIILLLGTVLLLKWHLQSGANLTEADHSLIPLERKRTYLRNLLTERKSAAELRLYRLAPYLIDLWRGYTDQQIHDIGSVRRRNIRKGLPILAVTIGIQASLLSVLLFLGYSGKLSVGQLMALFFALQQYLDRIQNISWRVEGLYHFFGGLLHLRQFLSMEGEEACTGMKLNREQVQTITFEHVDFRYPGGGDFALSDLNVTLRSGERLAVVGENGAGKTTFAKLLLGLYQPTKGRIVVDQTDLQTIDPRSWRERTAAVFQDYARFALTVRENIGFGRLEQMDSDDALDRAAAKSSIVDLVHNLPEGYDALLGKEFEGGLELSGGQWQKLALARANLRDAEVVVLDEPAAALDALAERDVYRNFMQLSEGNTVLLITHRLGSAQLADRILYMEKGRILEEGSHEELMNRGGKYAHLYRKQAEGYKREGRNEAE